MISDVIKAISIIFLSAILLVCGFILFLRIWSNHYMSKYENTKLGVSIEAVKDDWGKPDNIFYGDSSTTLQYNDRGVMTDYVFKFDKKSKKLVEKWSGD